MDVRFIIVGQGIGGTCIARFLEKEKVPFLVFHDGNKGASEVAAGIINPITGRKYVKSWMYEHLEQAFVPTYRDFEQVLENEYLHERKIIRAIPSVSDLNTWDARRLDDQAKRYMSEVVVDHEYSHCVSPRPYYGMVSGFQLNISSLVSDYRKYLADEQLLIQDSFDCSEVQMFENEVAYKGHRAKGIIFCEGFKAIYNPYFKHFPFSPAKGEALIIEIDGFQHEHILKDQIFLVPLGNNRYWAGATYAWDVYNNLPTEEKRAWIEERLDVLLKVPYRIIDHIAAVRPASKHRRPILATHPDHRMLHIFNGLGTKGSSLAPYFARKMVQYLLGEIGELPDTIHDSNK